MPGNKKIVLRDWSHAMHLRAASNSIWIATARTGTALVIAAATFAAASGATAGPTFTTLTGPSTGTVYSETASFNARVQGGGATGTVTFMDGVNVIATENLSPLDASASLAAGGQHTCALTAIGGVQCWGYNADGQLGDGTNTDHEFPAPVVGLSYGVVAVTAGAFHSCALTDTGAAKCWGWNGNGEIGDGTTTSHPAPVGVIGLTSGVIAIAAGSAHTCALTDAGAVKCWGYNGKGQLGDGTLITHHEPVQVAGLSSGVTALVAGDDHTCALTGAGAVKCWGDNTYGQIGDGTVINRQTPTDVSGLGSGISAIGAGGDNTCAITDAGAARCWGHNQYGQVGDGTMVERHIPFPVSGLASGVTRIDGGRNHTCALIGNGAIKCWGRNHHGQLGNNTTTQSAIPVAVAGFSSGGAALSLGGDHSCALTSLGAARCWGYNDKGEIGDGTIIERHVPVQVAGYGPGTASVPAEAAFETSDFGTGDHPVTARYNGDTYNASSTSAVLPVTVNKADTKPKLKFKPKKGKAGGSVRVKVKVKSIAPASGKPKGKVVLKDGRKKLGKFKLKKGKVKIRLRNLVAGKHKIKSRYKGNRNWNKSGAKKKLTVR
jgi:alpha-tubulin suppressor-like RCC1 family protein